MSDLYDGIPVEQLPIEEVNVPDPAHLRRSLRYPSALDIEPEHAVEAIFDPQRLIDRNLASRTGEAVQVVGYSPGMGRILVVLLVPNEHPPLGLWHIATAWPADRRTREHYRANERAEGP